MYTILRDIPQIQRTKQDHYDIEIKFEDINRQLLKELEAMEPFGMGNGKPVFRMTNARIDSYNLLKDIHVKWAFTARENPRQKLGGISFNFVGKWNTMPVEEIYALQDKEGLTVQFTLGINRFRGNEIIQLMVDKIFVGSM